MSSLRPREGGPTEPPQYVRREKRPIWIPIALIVLVIGLAAVGYTQYNAKTALEQRLADLEAKVQDDVQKLQAADTAIKSDVDVVTKHVGVTDQELASARTVAEKLRKDHEKAVADQAQLASVVAKKADTADVEANVAAARAETDSKVAAASKDSDTKISTVSGDVKTVASNLEATRQDLAASRRDLVDVKNALSDQIARNASELAQLRTKGEKNFFDIDLKKPKKKGDMQRVGDVRLELRDTDPKKGKYAIAIQVDDKVIEKRDKLVNEPQQFLVGKEQLRYEIVINKVDKDHVVGYLSTPKDKTLSAERTVGK